MKKIGQWIAGLQVWIKKTFDKAFAAALKLAPVAVEATEVIKKFLDSPVDDLILAILNIPGTEAVRDKLQQEWLPKIATQLALAYGLTQTSGTPEELLRKVQEELVRIHGTGADMRGEWTYISAKILEIMADGKVTWNELTMATQLIHYKLYIEPKK